MRRGRTQHLVPALAEADTPSPSSTSTLFLVRTFYFPVERRRLSEAAINLPTTLSQPVRTGTTRCCKKKKKKKQERPTARNQTNRFLYDHPPTSFVPELVPPPDGSSTNETSPQKPATRTKFTLPPRCGAREEAGSEFPREKGDVKQLARTRTKRKEKKQMPRKKQKREGTLCVA